MYGRNVNLRKSLDISGAPPSLQLELPWLSAAEGEEDDLNFPLVSPSQWRPSRGQSLLLSPSPRDIGGTMSFCVTAPDQNRQKRKFSVCITPLPRRASVEDATLSSPSVPFQRQQAKSLSLTTDQQMACTPRAQQLLLSHGGGDVAPREVEWLDWQQMTLPQTSLLTSDLQHKAPPPTWALGSDDWSALPGQQQQQQPEQQQQQQSGHLSLNGSGAKPQSRSWSRLPSLTLDMILGQDAAGVPHGPFSGDISAADIASFLSGSFNAAATPHLLWPHHQLPPHAVPHATSPHMESRMDTVLQDQTWPEQQRQQQQQQQQSFFPSSANRCPSARSWHAPPQQDHPYGGSMQQPQPQQPLQPLQPTTASPQHHHPLLHSSSVWGLSHGMGDQGLATGPAWGSAALEGADGNAAWRQRLTERCVALHPLYPRLIDAFCNCRKVGLVAAKDIQRVEERRCRAAAEVQSLRDEAYLRGFVPPVDSDLDAFMEKYLRTVEGYRFELAAVFQEAEASCRDFETRIGQMLLGAVQAQNSGSGKASTSSEGGEGARGGLTNKGAGGLPGGHASEDGGEEMKTILKEKYGQQIRELEEEFRRKKKVAKLPDDALRLLRSWWDTHLAWPYPKDEDKAKLAGETGLTATQINNWFINQRKRHWLKFFPEGHPATPEDAAIVLVQRGVISL